MEKETLLAKDVENIVLKSWSHSSYGHTDEYKFEADALGKHYYIEYEVNRHDEDEESFSIHSSPEDLWEKMPEPQLRILEEELSYSAEVGKSTAFYGRMIDSAGDLDELKAVEFMFMDDESLPVNFGSAFWKLYIKSMNLPKESPLQWRSVENSMKWADTMTVF